MRTIDPRRHQPPHDLLCQCTWCIAERDMMSKPTKRGQRHWVPGTKSPLEDENKRAGRTIDQEIHELFN